MSQLSTALFSLPPDFADNPTEAPFPRQLIIYEEKSNTWTPTVDDNTIANISYLCVSYRQSDFLNRQQLEDTVQDVCHQVGLKAYWLDYACTGESQEEKNRDLYRIADVFRGAAKTLIMIKGDNIDLHSPGWLSWGGRLWTLPEALLSGYREDKLLYKAGRRPIKSITLRQIANLAYTNRDEMELINAYSGEPVIASDSMFETLCKAIWRRSSGAGKGKEKHGTFTAYDAERVYAIMGFMARRILPDPNKSEEDSFNDLMKANKFDKHKFYVTILVSPGERTPNMTSGSVDREDDTTTPDILNDLRGHLKAPPTNKLMELQTMALVQANSDRISERNTSKDNIEDEVVDADILKTERMALSSSSRRGEDTGTMVKPGSPDMRGHSRVLLNSDITEPVETMVPVQANFEKKSKWDENKGDIQPLSVEGIGDSSKTELEAISIVTYMDSALNDPNMSIERLHASFGSSLDEEDLNIDVRKKHRDSAKYCLEVMNKKLKFNICCFDDAFTSYEDIDNEDLEMRKQSLGKALQYACRYWPAHITQMSVDDLEVIQEPLRRFLFGEKHLMQWVEVISIMGLTQRACDALLSLVIRLREGDIGQRTSTLICECYHLLRCLREPIASGPLQVYVSALPYAPQESLLRNAYEEFLLLPANILVGQIKDFRLLSPQLSSSSSLTAVAFSHDGAKIAFVWENNVEIFDFVTYSRIGETIRLTSQYRMTAFSPDGNKIAVADSKKSEVWDLAEHRALIRESDTGADIVSIAFPSSDRVLYCIRKGGTVELLNADLLQDGMKTTDRFKVGKNLLCTGMSPNARFMGCVSKLNKISAWKISDKSIIADNVDLGDVEDAFEVLSISCDGEFIACGSNWGTVKLWNSRTASTVWTVTLPNRFTVNIFRIVMPLSLENKQLITMQYNNMSPEMGVCVWDMVSGVCYEHEANSLLNTISAVSPDGRHLVTSHTKGARVWAIEAKTALLTGERLKEISLNYFADASLLAWGIGVNEGDIVIWDKLGTANAFRQTLKGHASSIAGLHFSTDGRRVVSRDDNNNVFIWSRDGDIVRFTLREKHKFDHEGVHLMDIISLFDGRILAACIRAEHQDIVVYNGFGSHNESKQILKLHTRLISLKFLKGNRAYIIGLRFSANGSRLVSRDSEENLSVWCPDANNVDFKLQKKYRFDFKEDMEKHFNKLTRRWKSDIDREALSTLSRNRDDSDPGRRHEPDAFFTYKNRWVCLANGRKLWYIPSCFSGWYDGYEFTERGRKMVVYGPHFALLFEYNDDVRTILSH